MRGVLGYGAGFSKHLNFEYLTSVTNTERLQWVYKMEKVEKPWHRCTFMVMSCHLAMLM